MHLATPSKAMTYVIVYMLPHSVMNLCPLVSVLSCDTTGLTMGSSPNWGVTPRMWRNMYLVYLCN